MAYIEKEPIVEFITKGLNNPDQRKAYGYDAVEILTEIVYTPVADVVPRSESAKDLEALEKTVTEIYNRYVFESNEYSDDDEAIEAVMNALTDVSNAIYELKEKHTKGGEA